MRIAIVGAGAIGGYAGVKLALAGEEVTFLARGANLAAIRGSGVKLIESDGTELVARSVTATADYAEAGPQDVVILAVKAHQVDTVAGEVPKLKPDNWSRLATHLAVTIGSLSGMRHTPVPTRRFLVAAAANESATNGSWMCAKLWV